MAAGSSDHPPMLTTGRYAQWKSRLMRYIDTRPNGKALKKCILQGPYKLSHIIILGQPATNKYLEVLELVAVKTFMNISPENKAHYDVEKEAIHLLLTGIGDGIYLTVDACKTAHDMWITIERFYKMMNEMVRNQLEVATMKLNVQFLQQLQPEWSRFIGQFRNQRTVTAAGATETVGSQVVQQTRIQRFSYKEFRHFSKECKKTKRVKDYTYHKEKMLLYKQDENGVPLQAKQADWLEDTDEESDEQKLKAHYSFMAKIQEVLPLESRSDAELLEKVQYDAKYNVFANERQHSEQPNSSNMYDNDNQADQNAKEYDDEHVVLANLKLDIDENKKIQKQLTRANTSLSQELEECKSILEECKSSLEKSNKTQDRYLGALNDG
nr:hypothetical protein [Tanacetum cinerariifolium]